MQGLAGHGTDFDFNPVCNEIPLKGYEWRSILRKHFRMMGGKNKIKADCLESR